MDVLAIPSLLSLPPHLPWAQIALAFAAMTVGAAVQGAVGFGAGLLASPILVMIDPIFVPGPMLIAALVLIVLMLIRDRQSIDVRGIGWALAGRVPGTWIAVVLLATLPTRGLVITVGALVVAGAVMSATGLQLSPTRMSLVAAGFLAGVMSTTASIGGPPMALVYQQADARLLRGTLAGHFLVGAVISLVGLHAGGKLHLPELQAAYVLVPGMVAGFAISARIAPRLDAGNTRAAVLLLSALAGLVVIIREIV